MLVLVRLWLSPPPPTLPFPLSPFPPSPPLWRCPPSALRCCRHVPSLLFPCALAAGIAPRKPRPRPPPIKPTTQFRGTPMAVVLCHVSPLLLPQGSRRVSPGPRLGRHGPYCVSGRKIWTRLAPLLSTPLLSYPLPAYPLRPPTPKQVLQHFPPSPPSLPGHVLPLSTSPPLPLPGPVPPPPVVSTRCDNRCKRWAVISTSSRPDQDSARDIEVAQLSQGIYGSCCRVSHRVVRLCITCICLVALQLRTINFNQKKKKDIRLYKKCQCLSMIRREHPIEGHNAPSARLIALPLTRPLNQHGANLAPLKTSRASPGQGPL